MVENFHRWSALLESTPHTELAETILEESGYTDMWQNDRSAEAPGRLDNLKELIRSMDDFESMRGFLEHVALVMDAEQNENLDAVSLMTLHSAKGLEFETIFLPGWEEGLFPHQRALDEGGRSGLEEERRLAYVGLTRAKRNCHIWFVSNRRIHGLWQSTIPSRFLDELPEDHVEVAEPDTALWRVLAARLRPWRRSTSGGPTAPLASTAPIPSPAATTRRAGGVPRPIATTPRSAIGGTRSGHAVEHVGYGEADSGYGAGRGSVKPRTIDGELVARSASETRSAFSLGDRVFHLKFGNGNIASIDGNKLTIDFDKAGQKRVLDGFVQPA